MESRIYFMPIFMNPSKKNAFLAQFKDKDVVAARDLRHEIGNYHYYNFIKQLEELNRLMQKHYETVKPMFVVEWERNPRTGRERKVVRKDPRVVLLNTQADIVLGTKSTSFSAL